MLEIAKGHRLVSTLPYLPSSDLESDICMDRIDHNLTALKGSYNETLVWPRIGVAGITVYDYLKGT